MLHEYELTLIVRADLDFEFSLMAMPISGEIRINGRW